ncbi:NADPH-dependent FMN reductase [Luteolibacter sp. LG18]|uniref:NADPH-dependent FMN reductase n=1 Tax=Luteolibacter sp. LG18 TaxID=2819286 RepID=UPI002B301654|nr:hypothetical protein llg_23410 [Luteolibacter sp. LG18]
MHTPPVRILGLCGSLRTGSSNRALLEVAAGLAPDGVSFIIHDGLGDLPLFRPDVTEVPAVVARFQQGLAAADAVWIASPEYAHGITGCLKNALDWVVASGEFSSKPVAAPNTSYASRHAHESLIEILATMDARVVAPASIRIPLPGSRITRAEILADEMLCELTRSSLEELVDALNPRPPAG